ncbi:hypothetical protein Dsin_009346 [Dipteronia sinensis]|uniref:Reverse transcriptase domain-containing protein n=1 Tax=Dipteronia sinensis TaxID=43782 RepID=A0AAE0EBN4_9ROSI|nr:hypothetical protein Dsin_009346 [Dipteronia sinensis]
MASGRHRKNSIDEISFEGVKTSNLEEIRKGVAHFFPNHFQSVGWRRPSIAGLPLNKLSVEANASLEENFSKEVVLEGLSSCDGNKAPGLDGFNLKFIKDNWDVIEGDFMKFMEEFYWDGSIVKELNKMFISLIPKCPKSKSLKDYIPISLVGSLYKILAKVLANMMRKVIGSVIGETQMAFVRNREILDSFVVAEEIIDHWKKKKERGLMVKLDFEKAYDSLDHSFLDKMLKELGFCWKWSTVDSELSLLLS